MNFSSLSSNEKLAVYGAVAAIIGIIVSSGLAGLGWLTLLAGIAMLVVVFLPQFSAGTELPGSKGSLMLIVGAVGGVAALLALLMIIGGLGFWFQFATLQAIFFLIGVAGGLLMAWAGWQEFQGEGGTFRVGTTGSGGHVGGSAAGGTTVGGTTAGTAGPTTTDTTGMHSTGSTSSTVGSTGTGSTDMGSEGGEPPRDDEGGYRNP